MPKDPGMHQPRTRWGKEGPFYRDVRATGTPMSQCHSQVPNCWQRCRETGGNQDGRRIPNSQLQSVSHSVIASRYGVYCHSAHFAPQLIRIKALLCTRRTIPRLPRGSSRHVVMTVICRGLLLGGFIIAMLRWEPSREILRQRHQRIPIRNDAVLRHPIPRDPPPQVKPTLNAASRAPRSTPVCPPETILMSATYSARL
jgi:hypothetical protein